MNLRDLGQQVDFLVPFISHAGEDRDTTGLLGVIGFGRKSPLSARFVYTASSIYNRINILRIKEMVFILVPISSFDNFEVNLGLFVQYEDRIELSTGTAVKLHPWTSQ